MRQQLEKAEPPRRQCRRNKGTFFDFMTAMMEKKNHKTNRTPTLLVNKLDRKHEQTLNYKHENKSNKQILISKMSLMESPSRSVS